MITVEFKNEQLKKLIAMDDGAIGALAEPNVSEKIEAIKIIIDWGQDIANGFIVEFNSAYTKFRKRVITNKQNNKWPKRAN